MHNYHFTQLTLQERYVNIVDILGLCEQAMQINLALLGVFIPAGREVRLGFWHGIQDEPTAVATTDTKQEQINEPVKSKSFVELTMPSQADETISPFFKKTFKFFQFADRQACDDALSEIDKLNSF